MLLGGKPSALDPIPNGLLGRGSDLELHLAPCFLLHNNCSSSDTIAMTYIPNPQLHEITRT
jgi:hypothetical protein